MENQQHEYVTKKERRQLLREEQQDEKQKIAHGHMARRTIKIALVALLAAGLVGFFIWRVVTSPTIEEADILSRNGIHWHPRITIYVDEERQDIAANIGIGAVHNPIHTHDNTGVIHLEFPGVVRADDITIEEFFAAWGKDSNTFGTLTRMTVNGEEHTEYGAYRMRDGDDIKLWYEDNAKVAQ